MAFVTNMRDIIADVFESEDCMKQLIRKQDGSEFDVKHKVLRCDSAVSAEFGSSKRYGMRLHFHVDMQILHKDLIQLMYRKIKDVVNTELYNGDCVYMIEYVWVKVVPPDLRFYIRKDASVPLLLPGPVKTDGE